MYTIAWWYMLATYAAVLAGLLVSPACFWAAIGLCLVQALHFGIEDRNFLSLSCQVRYALTLIFLIGLWEPARWIYWIPVAGLTVRLTVNYCLLARIVSLMPWNRKAPADWATVKRVIFSPPVPGSIAHKT